MSTEERLCKDSAPLVAGFIGGGRGRNKKVGSFNEYNKPVLKSAPGFLRVPKKRRHVNIITVCTLALLPKARERRARSA